MSHNKKYYKEYLSNEIIKEKLNNNLLLIGNLIINSNYFNERSYVQVNSLNNCDIVITSIRDRNRAQHHDNVIIEILPISDWIPFNSKHNNNKDNNNDQDNKDNDQDNEGDNKKLTDSDIIAENQINDLQTNDSIVNALWEPQYHLLEDFQSSNTESTSNPSENFIQQILQQSQESGLQPRGRVVGILPSQSSKKPKELLGTLKIETLDDNHFDHHSNNNHNNHQHQHSHHNNHQNDPSLDNLQSPTEVVLFHPHDNRYSPMIFPTEYKSVALKNPSTIFKATIGAWPVTSKYPQAKEIDILESKGSLESEIESLLSEYLVHTEEYPLTLLTPLLEKLGISLPSTAADSSFGEDISHATWSIPEEEYNYRLDLRHLRSFTIDPPFSKDLDQAMHITPIYSNTPPLPPTSNQPIFQQSSYDLNQIPIEFEIGVHIADVSFFIPEDSPLDLEARQRGNTVYLLQKSFPMLPRIFSEKFCSLQPYEDRLAISCIYRVLPNGNLSRSVKPWVGRTIVRSCCKLDYETAQRMIDNIVPSHIELKSNQTIEEINNEMNEKINQLSDTLWERNRRPIIHTQLGPNNYQYVNHTCWNVSQDVYYQHVIAAQRRKIRLENGALTLITSRLSFEYSPETNEPIHVSLQNNNDQKDSNSLIEEYMLLTNYLIAEKLIENISHFALLRKHHSPKNTHELTQTISKILKQFNPNDSIIHIKPYNTLHELMAQLTNRQNVNPQNEEKLQLIVHAISFILLKFLSSAEYFVVLNEKSENWKHYALSIPYYTHFTSPIRRYIDITVHRLLLHSLKSSELKQSLDTNYFNENKINNLKAIVTNCNDTKNNSKAIQRKCEEIYFEYYLLKNPLNGIRGIIIEIDERHFTLTLSGYLINYKIFYEENKKLNTVKNKLSYNKPSQRLQIEVNPVENKGKHEIVEDNNYVNDDEDIENEEDDDYKDHKHSNKTEKKHKHKHRRNRKHGQDDDYEDDDDDDNVIEDYRHNKSSSKKSNKTSNSIIELQIGDYILLNLSSTNEPKLMVQIEIVSKVE